MYQVCDLAHSTKRDGLWQRGDDETPGIVHCGNGVEQVKMQCNRCGHRSSPLPFTLVRAWGIQRGDIGWEKTNDPAQHEPCVVKGCGVTPTEWHHFAPRNTFVAEADDWPVLPLCRPHHIEWHRRMDGYRWNRAAVA